MTVYTASKITELIEQLKQNNQLFPDHIYWYDPFVDVKFDGLTDLIAEYAYLQEIQDDVAVVPDQFQTPKVWGRQLFKLVARTTAADAGVLLRFCLAAIARTNGIEILSYSDQAERIYFEETGNEIRQPIKIVRCVFSVSELIDCTKTITLCQIPNC